MAYKQIDAAKACWRALNGRHRVALVRGDAFHKDKLVERPTDITPPTSAGSRKPPDRRSPELSDPHGAKAGSRRHPAVEAHLPVACG